MKHFIRSALSLLLLLSFLLTLSLPCLAAEEEPMILDARGAVLMDAAAGTVLFSLNPDMPLYVAGLTTMMTALLAAEAVERGDVAWTDVVTASGTSHSDITADAKIQNIVPGEEMTLENLLYCALVGGASEACNIIAEFVSGSISQFVRDMNERAVELGCTGTNFVNTHGLPNENHFSTAYDMALIASEFVKHDFLCDAANTISKDIPATNVSGVRHLSGTNYIIRTDYTRYYYSYASGIKASYTDEAGYCLASSMKTEGSYVVSIVLGCRVQEADNGFYDIQSFIQTRKLFQWFNAHYSLRDVVSAIEPITEIPVLLAEGTDTVVCCSDQDLKLFLPTDLDIRKTYTREFTIYSEAEGAEPLTAPISRGQVLGQMTVRDQDGNTYGPFRLIANTDVAVSRIELMHQRFSGLLHSRGFRLVFWGVLLILVLYLAFVILYRVRRIRQRKAERAAERAAMAGRGKNGQ